MTENLIEARRVLADAQAALRAAQEKASQIETRITECRQRRQQITAARLEGEANAADTAEHYALGSDIETLSAMLESARQAITASQGLHDSALRRVAGLEAEHARDLAQAEFDAIKERADRLDAALCRAISELHRIGRSGLGHVAISQSWRPSSALDRVFRYGVAP